MNETSQNDSEAIKDQDQIVRLLEDAVVGSHPITVRLRGVSHPFHSLFDSRSKADLDAFRNGMYLLISPLDPPMGNIKIRFSPVITLSFFTPRRVISCIVTFMATLDGSLKLGFPTKLFQNPQKRAATRIKIQPDWEITVQVTRPSGLDFAAKIYDISATGIAFYPVDPVPMMLENARIRLLISIYPYPVIDIQGHVIGTKKDEGNVCYQTSFLHKTSASRKLMETMITRLSTKQDQRRSNLFGPSGKAAGS